MTTTTIAKAIKSAAKNSIIIVKNAIEECGYCQLVDNLVSEQEVSDFLDTYLYKKHTRLVSSRVLKSKEQLKSEIDDLLAKNPSYFKSVRLEKTEDGHFKCVEFVCKHINENDVEEVPINPYVLTERTFYMFEQVDFEEPVNTQPENELNVYTVAKNFVIASFFLWTLKTHNRDASQLFFLPRMPYYTYLNKYIRFYSKSVSFSEIRSEVISTLVVKLYGKTPWNPHAYIKQTIKTCVVDYYRNSRTFTVFSEVPIIDNDNENKQKVYVHPGKDDAELQYLSRMKKYAGREYFAVISFSPMRDWHPLLNTLSKGTSRIAKLFKRNEDILYYMTSQSEAFSSISQLARSYARDRKMSYSGAYSKYTRFFKELEQLTKKNNLHEYFIKNYVDENNGGFHD